MKRILMMLALAAMLVVALTVMAPTSFAKNGCTTSFVKGETVTTCTQGSHGSTDSHQGSPGSNGRDNGGGPCKNTGSDQTNTC